MDYWTKYFGTGSPGFQIPDEEDMEEFRSEKSVQSGKVCVCVCVCVLHVRLV